MTLIAYHGFGGGGRPIFVSDILLSAEAPTDKDLILPTVGPAKDVAIKNDKYGMVALGQKVAILNNNLVVSASGTAIYYRVFAKYLREQYELNKQYNPGEFMDFFQTYITDENTRRDLREIDVIGSHVTESGGRQTANNWFFSAEHDAPPPVNYESQLFGEVLAYGSGASSHIETVRSVQSFKDQKYSANPHLNEVLKTFLPVGKYLAKEVISGTGKLEENWGGGYEITDFANGRFHKLNDILYVIVDVVFRNNCQQADLKVIKLLKMHYEGEHLFVRSVDVDDNGDSTYQITGDLTVYVAPMIRTSDKPENVAVDLDNNDWFCYASAFSGPTDQDDSFVMLVPDYTRLQSDNIPSEIPPLPYSIKECPPNRLRFELSCQFFEKVSQLIYADAETRQPRMAGWVWP